MSAVISFQMIGIQFIKWYIQKRWDGKFSNIINDEQYHLDISRCIKSLFYTNLVLPRNFFGSCWSCGSPSFQFHSFRNRNRSFRCQQYYFESHFEIIRMEPWMIEYDEQTPGLLIFEMILLATEWPVTISKRMKLKRGTTTKSAWFGEFSWYYDFI